MSGSPKAKAKAKGPTDAARVRGAGYPLGLSDGTVVIVRFDFSAVLEVERRFGSILRYVDALDGSIAGPVFTVAAETVSIMLGKPVPAIAPLLEITKVAAYIDVILEAWEEAMPPPRPEAVPSDPKADGHGPTSTTSGPSGSAEATALSGG